MANVTRKTETVSATLHQGTGKVSVTYVEVLDRTRALYCDFPISALWDRLMETEDEYRTPNGRKIDTLPLWWIDNGPKQHRELVDYHMAALQQSDADRKAVKEIARPHRYAGLTTDEIYSLSGPDPDECYSQY